jgi:hypothetical protein
MLLELSRDFTEMAISDLSVADSTGLENILSAHTNGHHVLFGPREFLRCCSQSADFGARSRGIAKTILDNFSENSGLASSATVSALLKPTGTPLAIERPSHQFVLPISFFENPDAAAPAILLVENSNGDGKFFKMLRNTYARHRGTNLANLTLEVRHGGGMDTAEVLADIGPRSTFVLCIVDSDKHFPSDNLGDTAQAVESVIARLEHPTTKLEVLSVSETENLVPLEYLRLVYENDPEIIRTLAKIERLEAADRLRQNRPDTQFLRYFDFKDGLQRSKIEDSTTDLQKDFLLNVWKHLDPGETEFDTDPDLDDQICSGISSKILSNVVQTFIKPRQFDLFRGCVNRAILGPETEELAQLLVGWSMSSERHRAI